MPRPTPDNPARRRTRGIAVAGLVAAIVTLSAALASATLVDAPATGASGSVVVVLQDADVTQAFAELRLLIDRFEADGDVTLGGAARMSVVLDVAEFYHDFGLNSRAILLLGTFKQVANDPIKVPSDAARQQLIGAADDLIELLSSPAA